MVGGFNVMKDLYKTMVFDLARWRNQVLPKGALGPAGRVIPERIITKPPTAELKHDQKDEDTLPPYAVLDDILKDRKSVVSGNRASARVDIGGRRTLKKKK